MREWLSGGVSPCQGEGRGFESRLALFKCPIYGAFLLHCNCAASFVILLKFSTISQGTGGFFCKKSCRKLDFIALN